MQEIPKKYFISNGNETTKLFLSRRHRQTQPFFVVKIKRLLLMNRCFSIESLAGMRLGSNNVHLVLHDGFRFINSERKKRRHLNMNSKSSELTRRIE